MAKLLPLYFVLPASHASVSGGNVYNAALLDCLEKGNRGQRLSIAEYCDGVALPGIYIVDSLNLAEFQGVDPERQLASKQVLLVHHLPSLEPGLAADHPDRELERSTLARFDAFICTSQFTQHYLRASGYAQPSLVLEPVVASLASAEQARGLPIHALMSCNLIRRKGVLAFLQGLARNTKADDAYTIDLVGRSDMEAEYAAACGQCIEDSKELSRRVHLQGASLYEEMFTWYRQANLFVSASRMETFGISLQEARHHGLPILAVEGGNSANHVSADLSGRVYADPESLAEGFLDLARRPELFARYQKHAYENRPDGAHTWADLANTLVGELEAWFSCP